MKKQLKKFAETDLRAARRDGDHLVARTKLGNLTICHEGRDYRIVVNGPEPKQIYHGPKAGAVETLMSAYDVR